jgi:hypothetical protein
MIYGKYFELKFSASDLFCDPPADESEAEVEASEDEEVEEPEVIPKIPCE